MKVSIIGSGNVAWHLAQVFETHPKVTVLEVYSRNLSHAEKLSCTLLCTQATDDLNFSKSKAEIFILAVSDDAIEAVSQELLLPEGAIIAHTSGSQPLSILEKLTYSKGVFYPLQTFSKDTKVDFETVTFCIEGESPEVAEKLTNLAHLISTYVYPVSSQQRATLHIAAVFACNFTNYLWGISQNILQENGASLGILQSLIQETTRKALTNHPFSVQTGPAIRGDAQVIQKHLESLKNHPDYRDIYLMMTDQIQKLNKN